MKLYISGPMTGIEDFNYPLFREVKAQLTDAGFECVSPADIDGGQQDSLAPEEVKSWDYYMRKALLLQLECDSIALLPGWTRSKGARREFDIAVDLDFRLYQVIPIPLGDDKIKYVLQEF